MILALAFYGSLACGALWTTWHDIHLRTVGAMLCTSYLVSNASYFGGSIGDRPGIYTMLEIMVAGSAYLAHLFCPSVRLMFILIVAVSVLSICANVAFASIMEPVKVQQYIYTIATNACFASECLLTIWAGVRHGQLYHFHRRPHLGRVSSDSHAHGRESQEP